MAACALTLAFCASPAAASKQGPDLTAGGSFEIAAGTLVVPGPVRANAARLVLDGAASAVVYSDTTAPDAQRHDALGSLARTAAEGELVLRGGRSLTVSGAFANHGVLELGAGSTLGAAAFSQSAGAVLRPAVTSGGAGRVAASGAATLGGRLDTPTPATVAGDVAVLTASAVSGSFAAVTGGYQAVVGPADVKLHRPASLQPAMTGPAPTAAAADTGAPTPAAGHVTAPPPPAAHRRCPRQPGSARHRLRAGARIGRARSVRARALACRKARIR